MPPWDRTISEAIDKLEVSGKRLENTAEDEDSKELASKIEESTAGVGAGDASDAGSQSGGTQGISGAKRDINEKNVKLNDKKEEEVQEDNSDW